MMRCVDGSIGWASQSSRSIEFGLGFERATSSQSVLRARVAVLAICAPFVMPAMFCDCSRDVYVAFGSLRCWLCKAFCFAFVGCVHLGLDCIMMFALLFAEFAVCACALRAQNSIDPAVTRIDVRMEDAPLAGVASAESFSSTYGAAAGMQKAAAFLSSVSAGGPLDSIVDVLQSAPVHLVEPDAQVQAASALMREVAAEVGPPSPFVSRDINPDLSGDLLFCDRDYSQLCPAGFAEVGGGLCAPLSSYEGPCAGGSRSFGGLPLAAKERWSAQCAAAWPCKECARDFSATCPQGWSVDAAGVTCSPSAGYAGPCSGPISFAGYNANMLSDFSSSCGAFWACLP